MELECRLYWSDLRGTRGNIVREPKARAPELEDAISSVHPKRGCNLVQPEQRRFDRGRMALGHPLELPDAFEAFLDSQCRAFVQRLNDPGHGRASEKLEALAGAEVQQALSLRIVDPVSVQPAR